MKSIIKSEDIDVVFNLAVIPLLTSLEEPIWTWDENIKMTETICELAREKLFDTLIHFSSSEAYGSAKYYPMREDHPMNPTTPYAASKAAADLLVNSYVCTFGIDASIVRPFNNYGPRQNEGSYAGIIPIVIQKILSGKPPVIFGDGNQTRDFIFVGDVARAAIMAYKNIRTRKKAINIATGKEISINDLVRIIAKVMKYDGEIIHDEPRPGDVRQHWADISLAWNILGFEPNVGFEEGISDTVDWYIKKLNEI
jgi:UDP-glucose 4-epimerase